MTRDSYASHYTHLSYTYHANSRSHASLDLSKSYLQQLQIKENPRAVFRKMAVKHLIEVNY